MDFATFLSQINDTLIAENGPNLAYLLRPTSPHGKALVKEFRNPTVSRVMSHLPLTIKWFLARISGTQLQRALTQPLGWYRHQICSDLLACSKTEISGCIQRTFSTGGVSRCYYVFQSPNCSSHLLSVTFHAILQRTGAGPFLPYSRCCGTCGILRLMYC